MWKRLSSLLDNNVLQTGRLGLRAGTLTGVRCYGRVGVEIHSSARLTLGPARSSLGLRLLPRSTPRSRETRVSVGAGGTLALDGALIGGGVSLAVGEGATISVGCGSYVTDGTMLSASQRIDIGRDCAISWSVTLIDDDGHGAPGRGHAAPIAIEDHVWIGCHAIILKGVTLGAGSIIGAGAVVTRSCPAKSLLVGNPARLVREGVEW